MKSCNDESTASIFDLRSPSSGVAMQSGFSNHDFMLVTEAAEYLRVAPSTLYGWIHQRKIPFRKHGSRVVFSRKNLEAWSLSCESGQLKDEGSTRPTPCGKQFSAIKPAKGSLKIEQNGHQKAKHANGGL